LSSLQSTSKNGPEPIGPQHNALSVSDCAALCGVNRNTIGSWIRSGKLRAYRTGRKYSIPVEELVFFLKTTGQPIPEQLGDHHLKGPGFRPFQNCWHYFQGQFRKNICERCTVYKNRLDVCFTGKDSYSLVCNGTCHKCQYYLETYYSRIEFVHQLDFPAAVYKDLYFWGGNAKWAELCGVPENDLVGMGIENIYHPDSLARMISDNKKRTLGNPQAPQFGEIYIKHSRRGKLKVRIAVYPLLEPPDTWLLLADRVDNGHPM
jgi:excisionase family DNA binding protein